MLRLNFDLTNQEACLPHEKSCDLCAQRFGSLEVGAQAVQEQHQAHVVDLKELMEVLDWLNDHCIMCLYEETIEVLEKLEDQGVPIYAGTDQNPEGGLHHLIGHGRAFSPPKHRTFGHYDWTQLREAVQPYKGQPKDDSCCFTCLLPTKVCVPNRVDKGPRKICKWGWLVDSFLMAIGEDDQVIDVLGGKWRGTDLSEPHQVSRWGYQVDQDFFGTQALYGVVGLFFKSCLL
jgi:hypothetical protein